MQNRASCSEVGGRRALGWAAGVCSLWADTPRWDNLVQSLSCDRLCDPMDCGTPGLPVHHQLPESTQTHVHWVGDAIEPSHPLSPSPPALNLSQHQSLFKWVSSSYQVAKVLEFQLQHQSFQWIIRTDFLRGIIGRAESCLNKRSRIHGILILEVKETAPITHAQKGSLGVRREGAPSHKGCCQLSHSRCTGPHLG